MTAEELQELLDEINALKKVFRLHNRIQELELELKPLLEQRDGPGPPDDPGPP